MSRAKFLIAGDSKRGFQIVAHDRPSAMIRSINRAYAEASVIIIAKPIFAIVAAIRQEHVFPDDLAFIAHAKQIALPWRSEEHTSELQSLMRISYAVFCLKKKKKNN